MVGVEPIDKPTPVSPADNGLLADGLAKHCPESLPNLPPKQHELVDPGWSRPTCSTKMKYTYDKEPTPMEVPEFCTTAK